MFLSTGRSFVAWETPQALSWNSGNAVRDYQTLLYVSTQFKTLERCYESQCSSGLWYPFQRISGSSNFTMQPNAVQYSKTLLHRNAVMTSEPRCIYVPMQFRILESCYAFQCSSGLSNLAISFNALQDSLMQSSTIELSCRFQCSPGLLNLATRFNAVQDYWILI